MPPKTLFKYIAVQTVKTLGGLLVMLAVLIMLVDLIENMRFVGKLRDGTFNLAITLTLLRLPSVVQSLAPFVFLFGSIWMFHQLNRRSEISVMRSAGLSIWRLLGPAALISAFSGVLIITAIDPLSSHLLSYAEQLKTLKRGNSQNLVRLFDDGMWLRQRDATMQIIINAKNLDRENAALKNVTVWRFGPENTFLERIDADEATLSGRTMEMREARLASINDQTTRRTPLYAIRTSLTAENLRERLVQPETISLWQLPRFILLAESAGLPTAKYHLRFHDLCATPLKLLAMVLIAAAFSLRPTRSGGAFYLALMSIGSGFLLYILTQIANAFGESELAPAALAAWTPAIVATIAAVTLLLHFEEG